VRSDRRQECPDRRDRERLRLELATRNLAEFQGLGFGLIDPWSSERG
jgi:hypothetical protein